MHQSKKRKMETIERLREIVERNSVTSDDKRFIEAKSEELGIAFNPKSTKCKDCYIDQAVLLHRELTKQIEIESECHYRLRDDIDVIINGVRINNATLTDELAERYRGNNLPEHWFV